MNKSLSFSVNKNEMVFGLPPVPKDMIAEAMSSPTAPATSATPAGFPEVFSSPTTTSDDFNLSPGKEETSEHLDFDLFSVIGGQAA